MNDIPQSSSLFNFLLYADDTSMKSFINSNLSHLSIKDHSELLNAELEKVSDWLAVNMLSLNVKKTTTKKTNKVYDFSYLSE